MFHREPASNLQITLPPHVPAIVPDPQVEGRPFITDPTLSECPQLKIVRIDKVLYVEAESYVRTTPKQLMKENPKQKHFLKYLFDIGADNVFVSKKMGVGRDHPQAGF